jgi:hypothetical protein
MGTQKSSSGPTRPFPLLPPFAEENIEPSLPLDEPSGPSEEAEREEVPPSEDSTSTPTADEASRTSIPPVPFRPVPMGNLRSAKIAFGKFASGGGAGRLRQAGAAYVRGRGGSRGASLSAAGGRASTARLGDFLSSVARSGWQEAVRSLGLGRLVGQAGETVFAAFLNALAPSGATLEGAAARKSIDEALWNLHDRYELEAGDLGKLDRMDQATVKEVLEVSVVAYVYGRWLQELGEILEKRAMSDVELVGLENQVKEYVKDTVKLDLAKVDVLGIDWAGAEGRQLVQNIYQEAYSFLEVE